MRPRLIEALLRLYPCWWRERYEAEFATLLEETPQRFAALLDIVVCTVSARLNPFMEESMLHPVQRALPALFLSWLMAVAAGINLWGSVVDNPLVAEMRSYAPFLSSWLTIETGALLGLSAVLIAGAPLLVAMIRQTEGSQRRQLFVRLLILPGVAAGVIAWMGTVLLATRGQWVPMPWAITGDWAPPPSWPPLATRWILGTTTLVLLLAAGSTSAFIFRQMIYLATVPSLLRRSSIRRISISALVMSLLLMALSTGLWGFFANQYAPALFYAKFGGLLNLSTFSSWLVSFVLFAAAAAVAIRGARQYIAGFALL